MDFIHGATNLRFEAVEGPNAETVGFALGMSVGGVAIRVRLSSDCFPSLSRMVPPALDILPWGDVNLLLGGRARVAPATADKGVIVCADRDLCIYRR